MLKKCFKEKIRDFSTKYYFRKLENYISMLVEIKKTALSKKRAI